MTRIEPSAIEQKYTGYEGIPLPIAVYFLAFAEIDFTNLMGMLLDKPDRDDPIANARRSTAALLYRD